MCKMYSFHVTCVNGAELSNCSVISPWALIAEHVNHITKEQTLLSALVTGNLWNEGLCVCVSKPYYPLDEHTLFALPLCVSGLFVWQWITVHPCTDMSCQSPGFKSVYFWRLSSQMKQILWSCRLHSFPSQSHLHFQFGRAHCLPQLVAGPAHIKPWVRRLQIRHNQRTEPVFMLLHGHSGRFRHWFLNLKPLHLRLRVP